MLVNRYGEFSPPLIQCAISAGWNQNSGTFSADIDRLTDRLRMLGSRRMGSSIWFLGCARTSMHKSSLFMNGCRKASTTLTPLRDNSTAATRRAVAGTQPHRPSHLLPAQDQQQVAHPLMIALGKKMIQIDNCGGLERFLSEEDHPIQAFFRDAPHKPLEMRIEIGRSRRQSEGLHA